MVPIARDLARHGIAARNIEYRRGEGAWRETLDDVAAAGDAVTDEEGVVAMGHSAGGHLAGWLGSRDESLRGVVGLAPVLDLVDAERRGLGNHAARDWLGGAPDEVPERYAAAAVAPRVPLVIVHGVLDDTVPVEMSRAFPAEQLIELPRADHYSVIDPASPDWPAIRKAVLDLLA